MKELFKGKYRIETTRLRNHNYASDGYYFITICTHGRENYLGNISDGKMILSEIGKIANQFWAEISTHYPMAIVDEFIVMPNHVHGIIELNTAKKYDEHHSVETQNFASLHINHNDFASLQTTQNNPSSLQYGPQSKNIPAIVRAYKSAVKKYATIHKIPFLWQSRYYDRIIRTSNELGNVRVYIRNNVKNWNNDRNNI